MYIETQSILPPNGVTQTPMPTGMGCQSPISTGTVFLIGTLISRPRNPVRHSHWINDSTGTLISQLVNMVMLFRDCFLRPVVLKRKPREDMEQGTQREKGTDQNCMGQRHYILSVLILSKVTLDTFEDHLMVLTPTKPRGDLNTNYSLHSLQNTPLPLESKMSTRLTLTFFFYFYPQSICSLYHLFQGLHQTFVFVIYGFYNYVSMFIENYSICVELIYSSLFCVFLLINLRLFVITVVHQTYIKKIKNRRYKRKKSKFKIKYRINICFSLKVTKIRNFIKKIKFNIET